MKKFLLDFLGQYRWTMDPVGSAGGPINSVPSIRPSIRPQRAFLENASFNFFETWHEVKVTEAEFFRNFLVFGNQGQKVKFGPKFGFFENILRTLH